MFTAEEIKKVGFSKSMSGYKPEEVEIFLDKVAADYLSFEKIINEFSCFYTFFYQKKQYFYSKLSLFLYYKLSISTNSQVLGACSGV